MSREKSSEFHLFRKGQKVKSLNSKINWICLSSRTKAITIPIIIICLTHAVRTLFIIETYENYTQFEICLPFCEELTESSFQMIVPWHTHNIPQTLVLLISR